MDTKEILRNMGFNPIDRQEKEISTWGEFFKGNVKDFHSYQDYQGAQLGRVTRNRKSLGMAKVISEIWADNMINPETEFFIDGENEQKWLDRYISENGVKERLNNSIELAFAIGTHATVQHTDRNGKVVNQYVGMNAIYPLSISNGEIINCAFVSKVDDETIYIQIHVMMDDGSYEIKNKYFDNNGKPKEVNDGPEEVVKSNVKRFQLYSPAIVNNININNPLGISIFANAIEELKSVDIAYDALDKEIRNGRMRVYIQGQALSMEEGNKVPVFNKDQDEFFALPEDAKNPDGTLINVQAPTLRVESLINNLNKQLNLLGSKCGLGDNAFYSEAGTIYTNTAQVVSTNSKFYKTRQKHATRIETSLVQMIRSIYELDTGKKLEAPIRIDFDDSIIHDKDEEYSRTIQLYNLGLISRVQLYERTMNMTKEEAKAFNKEQIEEMELNNDVEEEGGVV